MLVLNPSLDILGLRFDPADVLEQPSLAGLEVLGVLGLALEMPVQPRHGRFAVRAAVDLAEGAAVRIAGDVAFAEEKNRSLLIKIVQ